MSLVQSLVKLAVRVGPIKRVKELYTGSHLQDLHNASRGELRRMAEAVQAIHQSRDRNTPVAQDALKHVRGKAEKVLGGIQSERRKVRATQFGTLGAGLGAAHGAMNDSFTTKRQKEKSIEKGGPITRAAVKHPIAYGAAVGAPMMAGMMATKTLPGSLAIGLGTPLALAGADYGLKKLEQRRQAKEAGFTPNEKLAVARELLAEGVVTPEQALAIGKYAAVSPEQARRSLDRLDTLESNKPSWSQARRYAAIGGTGGVGIKAMGNVIENYHPSALPGVKGKLLGLGQAAVKGATTGEKVRSLASMGATGALGAGVIPLARSGTDRRHEVKTLRRFMRENPMEQQHA